MTPLLRLARLVVDDPRAAIDAASRLLVQAKAKRARVKVKAAPRKKKRDEKKVTKARRRGEIRQVCEARSGGNCESLNCGRFSGPSLHMDHFWGRAREESVESCWMLCPHCDHAKTENRPTRGQWLGLFWNHCVKHGYSTQIDKAERAITFENAQHPNRSTP